MTFPTCDHDLHIAVSIVSKLSESEVEITMMPPLSFVFKNFLKKTVKNVFYLKTMKSHPKIATDSFENEP